MTYDIPHGPNDLIGLFSERSEHYRQSTNVMDTMVDAYFGNIATEFKDYFPDVQHVHLANFIRLAWDDLANLTAKEFGLFVPPDNDSATSKDKAELVEKVGYAYNGASGRRGGYDMAMHMKIRAWWLIGCGESVGMVLPDENLKTPFFTHRDPRSHYPPVGWTPWSQAPLNGTMFAYQMSLGELCRRYPDHADELRRKYNRQAYGVAGQSVQRYAGDSRLCWVAEYYHTDAWYIATIDPVITLMASETGDKGHPDCQPVNVASVYSGEQAKGRPFLADQISIQAAFSRLFSQKLDFGDQQLYPTYFTTPLVDHDLKIGPNAVNIWSTDGNFQPRMEVAAPANSIEADQTMNFVTGLQRMLNRNPEMMQGAGSSDSAKALSELKAGVNGTVMGEFWPPLKQALKHAYKACFKMDMALWGDERKAITGESPTGATKRFRATYVPNRDLKGFEDRVEIEEGIGLGGPQGTLEVMQLQASGLMSIDTALEQLPYYREPQAEKRRIQREKMEELQFALSARDIEAGTLAPTALAELMSLMQDDGMDMFDAIRKLQAEGKWTVPPQEAPQDPLAAAMAGMGGAPMGGPPPPAMSEMRAV